MYRICIEKSFDAAHHLVGYSGACRRPHGHRFTIKIYIKGDKLNSLGILLDFQTIKEHLKREVLDILDHYDLNEIPPFSFAINSSKFNPTAENIAWYTYSKLVERIKGLDKVRVYESPNSWAEYFEEESNDTS